MHIFLSLLGTLLIIINLGFFSGKSGFLNQNTSLEWFIDLILFGMELNSFILLYLIILLGLLVKVLDYIAGLSDGANISDTVSQFRTGCDWNISLSLPQMPHVLIISWLGRNKIFLIEF